MPAKPRPDRLLKTLAQRVLAAPEARDAFAFQEQLAESQWYGRDIIEAYQLGHLKALARHAARAVPYYRDTLPLGKIDRAATLAEALSHIPILPRDRLATDPDVFRAAALPQGQRCTGEQRSSGSTGQIVRIETTNLHYGWQNALNFRAHLWAARDFAKPIAIVRKMAEGAAPPPEGVRQEHWDAPTVIPVESASSWYLDTTATLDEIWDWLGRVKPAYLMTYPSILRELARRATMEKPPFTLSGASTIGETVDAELRALSAAQLGAEVHDIYSANEIGTIAIQCPASRRYHVQAEALIVEVVGGNGRTCAPGDAGRVLLTPLFNFATPLLRYDIGDYAEQGSPCACGRGLPTLNRILGRTRNMLTTPYGKLYWPALSNKVWQKIVPIKKFQLRQVALDRIEVWLSTRSPVTHEQEAQITEVLAASLPAPYHLDFHYVEDIAAGPGGKFEQVLNCVGRA
jgi:phenylacetate-coenzyme A ligase PaaK-like adenylate-forming protein